MELKIIMVKRRKISIVVLVSLSISASVLASPVLQQKKSDQAFSKLADRYFDEVYLPANPSIADELGIHKYSDKLEDYSAAGIKRAVKNLKIYEKQVNAIDPAQLSLQMQGDRELILNNIHSQLLTLETIRPWQKNPDFYSSYLTNSAFVLMERKFAPTNARLRDLIAREKLMPAILTAARENLHNPPKIYTSIALEQLPGLISFFQKDIPLAFYDATDPRLIEQFKQSNAAVIAAMQAYQQWLQKDLLPKSHGDFRIGANAFRKKLLFDEMVATPLDKLVAIDMANMRANQHEYARIAKELEPDKTPAQVLAEISSHHPAPDKLLASFRLTFDDLIRFIKEKKIITIPSDVRPTLAPTPPFMSATTFASMDTPGPYENKANDAFFNVTLPDSGWSKDQIEEHMRGFSYPLISSTSIHETYPGHYVQFLWMHEVHDRVRKLLGANSNAEGWAHYAEQMMLDEGFGLDNADPRKQKIIRLGQLQDALLRNARFIVGIKMHTGQMTFAQGVDFFVKEGYQARANALVEAKRGTSDPTYLYYTLGKLEILKLRADMQKKLGTKFSLQEFHDEFMRQGFPPIKIVRRAMLGDDSPAI